MVSKSKFVPRLVIIEGHEKGKVIPLQNGSAIIGRSKGEIIVQDPRVSRSHVTIQYDESKGHVTFTDLKSLNGTFLNGEESKSGTISDGDRLQVGDTIFDCQMTKPDTEIDIGGSDELDLDLESSREQRVEPKLSDKRTRPKEPELTPLDDAHDEPARAEPALMSDPKRKPRRISLRGWYLRIPVRKRIQILSLFIILIGVGYLALEDSPISSGIKGKVIAIRQQALSGDIVPAMQDAIALQEKNPNESLVHLLVGDLYAVQGDYQRAILEFQKALAIKPPNPVAHVKLIRMYLITKNNRGAVEQYTSLGGAIQKMGQILSTAINKDKLTPQQAIQKNPFIKELFVETAQLFLDFKELEEPPEQLLLIARALQKDIAPDSPVGYKLEAQLLFRQNQTQSAVALLEKAFALNSRDRWVIENLALAKYRLKDYAGTEQIINAWLQNFPDSARAYLTMAYLKFTQRDPKAALPYLQKIIEIGAKNPKEQYYPEALYWVGQVFLSESRNDEATRYVQQSCQLGYDLGCKSPLLERVPTSPANRTPADPALTNPPPSAK